MSDFTSYFVPPSLLGDVTEAPDYIAAADVVLDILDDLQGPWASAREVLRHGSTYLGHTHRERKRRKAALHTALRGDHYPRVLATTAQVIMLDVHPELLGFFHAVTHPADLIDAQAPALVSASLQYYLGLQERDWAMLLPFYEADGVTPCYATFQWRDTQLCHCCTLGLDGKTRGVMSMGGLRRCEGKLVPLLDSAVVWIAELALQLVTVASMEWRQGALHLSSKKPGAAEMVSPALLFAARNQHDEERVVLVHPDHPNLVLTFGCASTCIDHAASTLRPDHSFYDIFRLLASRLPLTEMELQDGWLLLCPTKPSTAARAAHPPLVTQAQHLEGLPVGRAPSPLSPRHGAGILGDLEIDAL